jgi:hypothetical protein
MNLPDSTFLQTTQSTEMEVFHHHGQYLQLVKVYQEKLAEGSNFFCNVTIFQKIFNEKSCLANPLHFSTSVQ